MTTYHLLSENVLYVHAVLNFSDDKNETSWRPRETQNVHNGIQQCWKLIEILIFFVQCTLFDTVFPLAVMH